MLFRSVPSLANPLANVVEVVTSFIAKLLALIFAEFDVAHTKFLTPAPTESPASKRTDCPDIPKEVNVREINSVIDKINKASGKKIPYAVIDKAGEIKAPIISVTRKKNGTNFIKYKEGTKGVSLAFSRGEKDPKGGLTQKGVDKYNRATGGNLKMAVTTPPSKLKPGSKAANRRKSFCARMSGVKEIGRAHV